jgi:hypothetical protein
MDDIRPRYRTGRRDYTKEILRSNPGPAGPIAPESVKRRGKRLIYLLILILLGIAGWGLYLFLSHRTVSPVPKNIRQAVSFPIYYPDPKKLPASYTLDTKSFTAAPDKNGVAYWINYYSGKRLVFSVQPKPSDSELQNVNSNFIPIRIDYQTPVGQAEIGTYNNQTFVSLPIINGPWIVITAPADINHDHLKQILKSVRR